MKEKLALVIAALVITSMAISISTTTVSAGVSPSSATVRGNTRVKLTFTITNDTGDNIENVRFTIHGTPTPTFSAAIGGATAGENLKLAADNLENARIDLDRAGENMLLAAENKKRAGELIISAAAYLAESATAVGTFLAWDNLVAGQMSDAATYLDQVGDNMALYTDNITADVASLQNAYTELDRAAGTAATTLENMWYYNVLAAENLDNAALLLDSAATALQGGSIRRAAENLVIAGSYMENAGGWLDDNNVTAGQKLTLAGTNLMNAGLSLRAAAQYDNLAGAALVSAAAQLDNTGDFIEAADTTDLVVAGDNLENAAVGIDNAGDELSAFTDNIFAAGDNLVWAALRMASSAASIGADLGGDYENAASVDIDYAGDNLKTAGTVNLKVAGESLKAAAAHLADMKTTLRATADSIGPAGWSIASDAANNVLFSASGTENHIANGGSKTFTFIWSTPNVGNIENVYTLKIYVYKPGSDISTGTYLVTLTVDGKVPSLTITVTQTGVVDNNVVGNTFENGVATVTIVASEAVELGSVHVENTDQENRLPPLSISTTDNLTFTATFSVGVWDDNAMQIRVASAKDAVANENTNMTQTFTVDTRAPILIDNGFAGLVSGMGQKVQAGTGTVYKYVDNTGSKQIYGRAEDNVTNADNDLWCTVYVGGELASKDVNENFFKTVTLSPGLNTVVVRVVDRTGNEVSENIDNIFIDTAPPQIVFNTISGDPWTENSQFVNDNTPEIKVTITDPGYPDSGLGVAFRGRATPDNLRVWLDNDDNWRNTLPALWGALLDNKAAWDPSTGVFENVIDNAGKGLATGTYWIVVAANDNLRHAALGYDNSYSHENWVIAAQSFTIDVTKPGWTTANVDTAMTFCDPANPSAVIPTPTKKTTWLVKGGAWEAGATVKVYVGDIVKATPTASLTEQTYLAGRFDFSVSLIDLSDGVNAIYIEEIDRAGNTSGKVLYGTYTVDSTPPVIILSAPADGATTDAAQITVSGTITDAVVAYDELTVTIDCTGAAVAKTVYLNADNSFSTTVPLVEGSNVINVVARDSALITTLAGNQTITTRTVTRTVTPWGIYAIIIVIVALILAAIAIFRKR